MFGMVNISVIVLVVGLLMVGGISMFNDSEQYIENIEDVYYGPVPVGYDLDNFRKTGDTIRSVYS